MTQTVLVLGGTGKVGRHGAQAFEAAGWRVRQFDRRTEDMRKAAQGCDLILNGLNPPNYHDWKRQIPKITARVIDAAQRSNAAVLLPGNVYHFGEFGGVWSEHTPARPVSRKGRIRLEMERAYEKSGVRTIVLRAGNFIDPDRRGCVMSEIYLRDISRGKITLPGPAHVRQAWCYLPDWARACAALAEKRDEFAQFEDIPFPGHTLTAQDIREQLEQITGRTLRFKAFPWRLFWLASPVWELARELRDMHYLWRTDHALSAEKFNILLPGFEPSPVEEVMRAALSPELSKR